MAGLNAGHAFSDWPLYAGKIVPPGMFDLSPIWINHFENAALVHFQHRTMAYAVGVLGFGLCLMLGKHATDKGVHVASLHVLALLLVQIVLGIFTVTSGVAVAIAAAHQVVALLLFGAALWLVFAVGKGRLAA